MGAWGLRPLGGTADGTTATFTFGEATPIEFPPGWSAADDPLRVLDARGRVVAAVGGTVSGGGGFTGDPVPVFRGRISRTGDG